MDFKKKSHLIILSIFFIVIFFVLAPVWSNPNNFFQKNNDFSGFVKPQFKFFKDSFWDEGIIPLWQNRYLSGYPLLGDPQTILLYPINYLSLIIKTEQFFVLYYILHLLIAGVSTYYLARLIFNLSIRSSFVVGAIYALSPKFIAHIEAGHPNLVASYCYIPLVLLLFLMAIKKPSISKIILFSFTTAMVYLLYLTTFYYLLLLLVVLTLYQLLKTNHKKRLSIVIFLGLSGVFFLGFLLPELLASIELWPQLSRNLLQFPDVAGSPLAWRQYLGFLISPSSVANTHTEMVLYLGLPVIIIAFIGFIAKTLKNQILIGVILIACFFYAIGPKTPLYIFLYQYLPGVSLFRIPSRMWFIVILILAVLAGFGMEIVVKKRKGKILGLLIMIIIISEYLYLANLRLSIPSSVNEKVLPKELLNTILNNNDSYFRLYCPQWCPSFTDIKKPIISVTGGYNPVQLSNYFWFFQKAAGFQFASYAPALPPYQTFPDKPQPDATKQGILGVRYILSPYLLTDKHFLLEKSANNLYLYKNTLEKPRIYLLKDKHIIPLRIVIDKPGYLLINLDGKQEGKIILNEIYTYAWKIYKDGKKENVDLEDDIIISSKISRGNKQIIFSYEPLGVPYSWYILIICYLLSFVLIYKDLKK